MTDVLFIHQTFVEQTVRLTQGGCSGDVRGNTGRVRRVRSVCIETSACLSRVQLRLQGSLSSESTSFFGIHICNPCSFFSIHVRDPCSLFSVYVRDASRDFVVDGGLQCGFGAFSAQLLCVYICDTCSFLSVHISNPCSFLSIHVCNPVCNLLRDLRLKVCFHALSTGLLCVHICDTVRNLLRDLRLEVSFCSKCTTLFSIHIQDASSFFGIDVRNAVRDFRRDLRLQACFCCECTAFFRIYISDTGCLFSIDVRNAVRDFCVQGRIQRCFCSIAVRFIQVNVCLDRSFGSRSTSHFCRDLRLQVCVRSRARSYFSSNLRLQIRLCGIAVCFVLVNVCLNCSFSGRSARNFVCKRRLQCSFCCECTVCFSLDRCIQCQIGTDEGRGGIQVVRARVARVIRNVVHRTDRRSDETSVSAQVRDAEPVVINIILQAGLGSEGACFLSVHVRGTGSNFSRDLRLQTSLGCNCAAFFCVHVCSTICNLLGDLRLQTSFRCECPAFFRVHIGDASSNFSRDLRLQVCVSSVHIALRGQVTRSRGSSSRGIARNRQGATHRSVARNAQRALNGCVQRRGVAEVSRGSVQLFDVRLTGVQRTCLDRACCPRVRGERAVDRQVACNRSVRTAHADSSENLAERGGVAVDRSLQRHQLTVETRDEAGQDAVLSDTSSLLRSISSDARRLLRVDVCSKRRQLAVDRRDEGVVRCLVRVEVPDLGVQLSLQRSDFILLPVESVHGDRNGRHVHLTERLVATAGIHFNVEVEPGRRPVDRLQPRRVRPEGQRDVAELARQDAVVVFRPQYSFGSVTQRDPDVDRRTRNRVAIGITRHRLVGDAVVAALRLQGVQCSVHAEQGEEKCTHHFYLG